VNAEFDLDTAAINQWLADLGQDVNQAVRPAAQAGAQVFYDQVHQNISGLRTYTGNLKSSIYQTYSEGQSLPQFGVAVYQVSWNSKKAPHGHLLEFGHRVEYVMGTNRIDGTWTPFVRPEYRNRKDVKFPGRRAPAAEKQKFYITRRTEIRTRAFAFVRSAANRSEDALNAAEAKAAAVLKLFV
jgi:hypothetical protein